MKLLRWAWLDLLMKAYFFNKAMWCVPFRTFTLSIQVVFKESCPVTRDHMHYPESLNLLQRIAEDLHKQIFLSFWSSLPSGSFGTSLAWIFRIAKMLFIMTCPVIISMQTWSTTSRTLNRHTAAGLSSVLHIHEARCCRFLTSKAVQRETYPPYSLIYLWKLCAIWKLLLVTCFRPWTLDKSFPMSTFQIIPKQHKIWWRTASWTAF